MNYQDVYKQAYAVFKEVKQFRLNIFKKPDKGNSSTPSCEVSFCTKGIRRKKGKLGNSFTRI